MLKEGKAGAEIYLKCENKLLLQSYTIENWKY